MKHNQGELARKQRHATQLSLLLSLLPLLTIMVWAGCQQRPKVAADISPAGTYTLVTVDGKNVPCTVEHEGHSLAVKAGSFVIGPEGTCSSKVVFGPPSGGDVTREVKAAYTRQGSKLTMQWEGAGMTSGAVEGDTFTMNNEGMIFVYRK